MKKHRLNILPEMQQEAYSSLKNDIEKNGFDNKFPIYIYQDEIIDGWNRFKACKELKVTPIYKNFTGSSLEALTFILRTNNRRDLTSSQRACLAADSDEIIETLKQEIEEQRRKKISESRQNETVEKIPQSEEKNRKLRTKLAETFGTNSRYVSDAQRFKKEKPEVFEQIKNGTINISEAKKEEKKEERDKKIQEVKQKIESENLTTLDKKYHVIAIDPPWAYNEKGGFSSDDYDAQNNRGAVDYPTMTVEQIKKIELPAADDSVLFLWTTHAFLRDSFDIMKEWGFEYKATIVWDKVKMGMGRNVRMQVEFCLLGIKGKPIIQGSSERDIITEPRREHSRKPEAFYKMVERMCIGNKLDYFSRQTRKNWEHYGAEQGQF